MSKKTISFFMQGNALVLQTNILRRRLSLLPWHRGNLATECCCLATGVHRKNTENYTINTYTVDI